MNVQRVVVGVALAILATGLLGALSRAPYAANTAQHAFVRLSWRSAGRWASECRRLSPEEIARQPVHMRQEEECARRLLPELVRVVIDGDTVIADSIRAAGAKGDRPLYVNREVSVNPGEHRLAVQLIRTGAAGDAESPGEITLSVDTTLILAPREISLVTLSADGTGLVLLGRGTGPRTEP